jgi:hypothetical protein
MASITNQAVEKAFLLTSPTLARRDAPFTKLRSRGVKGIKSGQAF